MKRRYQIFRDEPGAEESVVLDYAATEEECRRKLADWNCEYPWEVSAYDRSADRNLYIHDGAQEPFNRALRGY
jgi:hypothetical protein